MAQEINKQWAYLISRGKTFATEINKQYAYVLKGPLPDMALYAPITFDYEVEFAEPFDAAISFDYEIYEKFSTVITFDFESEYETLITFSYDLPLQVTLELDYRIREKDTIDIEFDYVLKPEFGALVTFDYEAVKSIPARLSQVPVMVVELVDAPVRLTQVPIQMVYLPDQPTRITQAPILVLIQTKPPRDLDSSLSQILPEPPVTEVWAYYTVVNQAKSGREQRSQLRAYPRAGMRFNMRLTSDDHRRQAYEMFQQYIDREFLYPTYQYGWNLNADAAEGATELFLDTARLDIRVGEHLSVFDSENEANDFYLIKELYANRVVLEEPLRRDVSRSEDISGALWFRFIRDYSLNMEMVKGEMSLFLETTRPRTLERVSGSNLLTRYDGLVVMAKRPADVSADENYTKDIFWHDNQISSPTSYGIWKNEFFAGRRLFTFDRYADIAYYRAFAEAVKGRLKPFLLPTYRNDIVLSGVPVLGAAALHTDNALVHSYVQANAQKYLRIVTGRGIIYRRIAGAGLTYGTDGVPNGTTLFLDTPLGSVIGDNNIIMISFMHKVRLDNDEIIVTHHQTKSVFGIDVRTINE